MLPTRQHASTPTHRPRRQCGLICTVGGVAVLGMGLVMGSPTASAVPSAGAIDAINHRYADFGGASSLLGTPMGAAVDVQGGARQDYSGGAIFYSGPTGAKVMYGQILEKFRSLGGPDSGIGFPVNDESPVGDDVGRFNNFSEPGGAAIYWTPAAGASVIKGRLLDAWRASGATTGPFGYPRADMTEVNGVSVAKFVGPQGTEIRWSDSAGLATVPPALAASIPGFKAATPTAEGTAVVPTPNVSVNPPAHGFKWWPLAIGLGIAALLASLLSLAGRRWRDRRHRLDVPTARPPEVPRPQMPAPPRVVDTARGPKVKAPASAVPGVKVPDVPPSPPKAPVAPERPMVTDTNGEPVKAPNRPRPASMQPSKPPTTTRRFAETPAPPKAAPSQPPVPPPRTVDLVEQGGKTPPLVVNYDSDPAHDIGGIEVTYENNAVGENQQSRRDKSYSAQVGHLGP